MEVFLFKKRCTLYFSLLLVLCISCKENIKINGTYEIIAAYSHLYHDIPYDDNYEINRCNEIETKKLGEKIKIHNNKLVFENDEYQIINGNGYCSKGVLEYDYFTDMFAGLNYGFFDENIIGKDYTGTVKAMTIKNEKFEYYIYFADNKLIIQINADRHETEFEYLIVSEYFDIFFYIAEKINA
jgi:hypothetical protein